MSQYASIPSRAELERMLSNILALLDATGLRTEIEELVTSADDARKVVRQLQELVASGADLTAYAGAFRAVTGAQVESGKMASTLQKWCDADTIHSMLQEPRTRLSLDVGNAHISKYTADLRSAFRLRQSGFTPESVIPEGDALEFWIRNFGSQHMIAWTSFEAGLESDLRRRLSDAERQHLRNALDASESGRLSAHKFAAFVEGFGPGVSASVQQLSEALSNTWFHGFLSYSESMNLLKGARPGTFLVRFSQSSPCAFALVVVIGADNVQQYLINTSKAGGFELGDSTYSTLSELVSENRTWLKHAAPNELSTCKYFHGFLTFPETVELLSGKPKGCFLLRFSHSKPGSLVVALKNEREEVQQSLIYSQPERGGYMVGGELYSSLDKLIQANSHKLIRPLLARMYSAIVVPPTGLVGHVGQTSRPVGESPAGAGAAPPTKTESAGAGGGTGESAGRLPLLASPGPRRGSDAGGWRVPVTAAAAAAAAAHDAERTGAGQAPLLQAAPPRRSPGSGAGAGAPAFGVRRPLIRIAGAGAGGATPMVSSNAQPYIPDEYGPMPGGVVLTHTGSSDTAGSGHKEAEKGGNPGAPEPDDDRVPAPLHIGPAAGAGGAGSGTGAGMPRRAPFLAHAHSKESFLGVLPDGTSPHGSGPASNDSAAAVAGMHFGGRVVPPTGREAPVAIAGPGGMPVAVARPAVSAPLAGMHPVASLQPRAVRSGLTLVNGHGGAAAVAGAPAGYPGDPTGGLSPGYGVPPAGYPDTGYPAMPRVVANPGVSAAMSAGFAAAPRPSTDLLSSDSGMDYAAMPVTAMHLGGGMAGPPRGPAATPFAGRFGRSATDAAAVGGRPYETNNAGYGPRPAVASAGASHAGGYGGGGGGHGGIRGGPAAAPGGFGDPGYGRPPAGYPGLEEAVGGAGAPAFQRAATVQPSTGTAAQPSAADVARLEAQLQALRAQVAALQG